MKRQLVDVSLPHQYFSASLSPSLPLSLKINKILKEIYHANHNLKMTGVITLISDKIDFKTKIVPRDLIRAFYNDKKVHQECIL